MLINKPLAMRAMPSGVRFGNETKPPAGGKAPEIDPELEALIRKGEEMDAFLKTPQGQKRLEALGKELEGMSEMDFAKSLISGLTPEDIKELQDLSAAVEADPEMMKALMGSLTPEEQEMAAKITKDLEAKLNPPKK